MPRWRSRTELSALAWIHRKQDIRQANSNVYSTVPATQVSFCRPMPAKKGRRATSGKTLDVLGVARIDHGIRSMEDQVLVGRLAREKTALTVCPLSNLRLRVVDDLAKHPLRRMLDKGLMVRQLR